MEVLGLVGLLVAFGVWRNWSHPLGNMVSAEDVTPATGRQTLLVIGLVLAYVVFCAVLGPIL